LEETAVSFEHAKVLWVAAMVVPLLALFLWGTWRRRQALIRQFVQHKMLAQLSLGSSAGRQKLRRVLLVMAVAFLLLAIARPQWGFAWEEASQRGRDVVIAVDTSRSMLAEDVQPNRLTRAKLAALDLLKLGQYDRFGLVAFAGTAFLQCPLTFDEEAFRQSVGILEPGILPQGGTAIRAAIEAAREAFGEDADDNHKVIVLFTDGEDHEQGVMDTVERAADAGVRIFTIGAGTPAGEVLRARDERGNLAFIKDDAGNVVKSRLNEALLRQIATTANGFYLPLNAANAMEVLYQKGLAPLPTSERTTKLMKRLKEQFYWPLGVAILLLIIEVFIPEQKRAPKRKPETSPLAPMTALLLFLFLPAAVQASPATALRKYHNREFKGALEEYEKLLAKSPNDPRLRYNAGAAAFQAKKFDAALDQFQAAAASPDLDLQQQSFYNLGNTEYRLGESNSNPNERMASWEKAIQNYEAALRLNAADQDAAFNRDFVRQKLEELKKQQEQPKDQQKNNEEQKDDEEQEQKNNQDQNQKPDQQKKDNQQQENSQDQKQPGEDDEQQPQAQEKKDEQEKADQSQAKKEGGEKDSGDAQPEEGEEGQYAQLGKMTPAQAKQLLDAQRSEEKALLFIPQERKSLPRDRIFKDW
jgi:Ca-activated chloride channel family protein